MSSETGLAALVISKDDIYGEPTEFTSGSVGCELNIMDAWPGEGKSGV